MELRKTTARKEIEDIPKLRKWIYYLLNRVEENSLFSPNIDNNFTVNQSSPSIPIGDGHLANKKYVDDSIIEIVDVLPKNLSWGESYINNYRSTLIDLSATYFPNSGGYEAGRLHQLGAKPSLHFIPSAIKAGTLYSLEKSRINDFTVARNSTATYVDEDGIIQTAQINEARIDYTNGNGVLLAEPQSTNLYLNSQAMVTQGVTTAASDYTVSFYGTGTITFTGTYTGSLVGTGENDLVQLTFTATAGTLTSTISGAVDEGQIENLGYATSRIRTTGTTETRLADVITDAGDVNTFNSEEGVLYVEMAALADDGTYREMSISDSTTSNRLELRYKNTSSNEIQILYRNGGGIVYNYTHQLSDVTEFVKVAVKWKQSDFSMFIDGVEVNNQLSGNIVAPNVWNVFNLNDVASNNFYGKIGESGIRVYKSIAEAQKDLTYIT